MAEDKVQREAPTQTVQPPKGVAAMEKAARSAIPLPADQFLIQVAHGLVRIHFYDSAGNQDDPLHRTSVVLGIEPAKGLQQLLTTLLVDLEKGTMSPQG